MDCAAHTHTSNFANVHYTQAVRHIHQHLQHTHSHSRDCRNMHRIHTSFRQTAQATQPQKQLVQAPFISCQRRLLSSSKRHRHAHTNMHIHTCTYTHAHAQTCTYTHARTHMHIQTSRTHMHIHRHARAHMHKHRHAHTQTCTCTQTCTFTHMHAHSHTRLGLLRWGCWLWLDLARQSVDQHIAMGRLSSTPAHAAVVVLTCKQ